MASRCSRNTSLAGALAILVILAAPSRPARAEFAFEVVKDFGVPDSDRSALVVGGDGAFYGTTGSGGASNRGTIFRIDGAGNFTRLHSFSGTDGSSPQAAPVLGSDGALYGTTPYGGTFGWGTVFRIDSAGVFTSLHSFSETGPWYYADPALVLGSDRALYGITRNDYSGLGTVFRIDSAGSVTTLHSFTGADGAYPSSLVVGSDGALYGTSGGGFASDIGGASDGTIFRIDNAGTFTTLHRFSGTDGSAPNYVPLTLGSDGALYGTTRAGGSAGLGTIYRIDGAGRFTTLHSFAYICQYSECHQEGTAGSAPLVLGSDGALYGAAGTVFRIDGSGNFTVLDVPWIDVPSGSAFVLGSDGALYGTTRRDNINYGSFSVFRIDSMGTFTSLSSSDDTTVSPIGFGTLVRGRDGALYGATSGGGAAGLGAFVRIDPPDTYTILHSFRGVDGGQQPLAALVAGSDGALYGATARGGPRDMGTVFRIDSTGTFSSLHSFSGADGASPTCWIVSGPRCSAALVLGSDGVLYGTTSGRTIGYDWRREVIPTIFKIDRAGTFTSLHSFTDLRSGESAALARGGDGVLYGGTRNEVFKIDATGTFTSLHSFFDESSDPDAETCPGIGALGARTSLVVGSDDVLYGFYNTPGFGNKAISCAPTSTVFRIDGGNFTTLYHAESYSPSILVSSIVVGSDDALYGTTSEGIFRIDAAGTFTTLYQEEHLYPSSLVVGSDGALYGTADYDSGGRARTVFRIDGTGNFTSLHSFTYADGYIPYALVLGSDGALYGTTFEGRSPHRGTVFRIDTTGTFSSLHSFEYVFPSVPILGSDCALYGTAADGGPAGGGVVYRLYEPGHLCQRIEFDPLPDRILGDPPFTVSATSSSGLPVSFTASGSCTLRGDQVTLTSVGICTLEALQPGDANYEAAPDVSQSFHVFFDFDGFRRPVMNPPVVNRVKAGRTVPIRFSLGSNQGRDVLAEGTPEVRPVPCDASAPVNDIGGLALGHSSSLRHAPKRGLYTYLWKTDRSWAGTCRELSLELSDGSVHRAIFRFAHLPSPRGAHSDPH